MSQDVQWDRIEPVEPCTSPDGHDHVDYTRGSSYVPVRSICSRCGRAWQIVVLPRDDTP